MSAVPAPGSSLRDRLRAFAAAPFGIDRVVWARVGGATPRHAVLAVQASFLVFLVLELARAGRRAAQQWLAQQAQISLAGAALLQPMFDPLLPAVIVLTWLAAMRPQRRRWTDELRLVPGLERRLALVALLPLGAAIAIAHAPAMLASLAVDMHRASAAYPNLMSLDSLDVWLSRLPFVASATILLAAIVPVLSWGLFARFGRAPWMILVAWAVVLVMQRVAMEGATIAYGWIAALIGPLRLHAFGMTPLFALFEGMRLLVLAATTAVVVVRISTWRAWWGRLMALPQALRRAGVRPAVPTHRAASD